MQLFIIDGKDFTPYIDADAYAVDRKDEYEEWQDGNWISHRIISRTRVSGSFQIGFSHEEDRDSFLEALAAARKQGGYYLAAVYVNNVDEIVAADIYMEITNITKRDVVNNRMWSVFSVKIEER